LTTANLYIKTFKKLKDLSGPQGKTGSVVRFVEDENLVREYHVATWGLIRKADAYVAVTNKRLVFFTEKGTVTKSHDVNDTEIQGVKGIDFEIGGRSMARVLIGLVIFILGIYFFPRGPSSFFFSFFYFYAFIFSIIFLIVGLALLWSGTQKKLHFTVKSDAFSYPFAIEGSLLQGLPGGWFQRRKAYPVYGGAFMRPSTESEVMAREIGAIVMDVRSTGTTTLKTMTGSMPSESLGGTTPEQQLATLKSLKDRGLISDQEFEARKAKVLESI
jgi:hypothetical protein